MGDLLPALTGSGFHFQLSLARQAALSPLQSLGTVNADTFIEGKENNPIVQGDKGASGPLD